MINLDKVAYSTLTDTYINYDRKEGSIFIPGATIGDGSGAIYTSSQITFSRGNTRADVYLERSDGSRKTPANNIIAADTIYQFTSFETTFTYVNYTSSGVTVDIGIQNDTGGSITLISQTIKVPVVQSEAPINNL